MPVSAAGYNEFKGDVKYRDVFQKSLSLIPKTWQDGVAELASVIEAPDFIGWTSEPAAIAAAASALLNQIIADALAANATCWDGSAFFADAHPFNVFDADIGTYDNDFTGAGTTLTAANLKLAKSRMRKIKAPNGKPLGLRLTHILIPSALEETAKDLLEQDMVIQASGSTFADQSEEVFSLFASQSLQNQTSPWKVTGGLRANANTAFEDVLNPELKLVYQQQGWNLTGAYSGSNNIPSFYQHGTTG